MAAPHRGRRRTAHARRRGVGHPRPARALRIRVGRRRAPPTRRGPASTPKRCRDCAKAGTSTSARARGASSSPRRSAQEASASIRAPAATAYPRTAATARSGRGASAFRRRRAVVFVDRLQGTVAQDLARDVGDFVLRRADGLHAYQLAVVVDDALSGVNAVVRGADLLVSTPRQILLQRLLGYATPSYLHTPGRDRSVRREAVEADASRAAARRPAADAGRGLALSRSALAGGQRGAPIGRGVLGARARRVDAGAAAAGADAPRAGDARGARR